MQVKLKVKQLVIKTITKKGHHIVLNLVGTKFRLQLMKRYLGRMLDINLLGINVHGDTGGTKGCAVGSKNL